MTGHIHRVELTTHFRIQHHAARLAEHLVDSTRLILQCLRYVMQLVFFACDALGDLCLDLCFIQVVRLGTTLNAHRNAALGLRLDLQIDLVEEHIVQIWDSKRLGSAFPVERERSAEQLSARDRAVLDASKALEAASASGDAQQIRAAMAALELAIKEQAKAVESDANQPQTQADQAQTAINSEVNQESAKPVAAAPVRPVVAVRGDDRPGMRKAESAQPARAGRPGSERRDARDGRGPRDGAGRGREREAFEARGPRLGDTAFRAQRDAMEHAQTALRKLAAQAHGEALTQLMAAWKSRDAEQLPTLQELGGKVSAGVRAAWGQAIAAAPAGTGTEQALLRLEMAADVPTPADQLAARRALQLQMLTRRNDPAPAQTWAQDAAQVLAGASDEASARRLQSVLKVLLRK